MRTLLKSNRFQGLSNLLERKNTLDSDDDFKLVVDYEGGHAHGHDHGHAHSHEKKAHSHDHAHEKNGEKDSD